MKRTALFVLALACVATTEDASPIVNALVDRLGDEDPAVREAASADLAAMGDAALPDLERSLAAAPEDPEVRARLEGLVFAGRARAEWTRLWTSNPPELARRMLAGIPCPQCGESGRWTVEPLDDSAFRTVLRRSHVFVGSCRHASPQNCSDSAAELAVIVGELPGTGGPVLPGPDFAEKMSPVVRAAGNREAATRAGMLLATLATLPRESARVLDSYSAGDPEPLGGEFEVKWMSGDYLWLFTFEDRGEMIRVTLNERDGC
jgi:hypothetical protein